MSYTCSGSKKKPEHIGKPGQVIGKTAKERFYGWGWCARCGRVVGLSPKNNLVVRHKVK